MLLLWILSAPLDKFSTFGSFGEFGKFWAEGRGSVEPWKALRAAINTARLKSGPDTNLIAAIPDGNSVGKRDAGEESPTGAQARVILRRLRPD
jgi:predicted deacylase